MLNKFVKSVNMNFGYIILAYLSLFSISFIDNGKSAVYPFILEDFQVSSSKGSIIFSLPSLFSLLVNVTSKFWLPALGIVNGARASLFVVSLGTFLLYYANTVMNFNVVILASVLVGVGFAMLSLCMNLLIAKGTLPQNRKRFYSGLHSVYGIASFIAPLLLNLIFSLNLKWSFYFLALFFIPIVLIATSYFFLQADMQENSSLKGKLIIPLPFGKRFPFGFCLGLYVTTEVLLSSRLVHYLKSVKHFSTTDSNYYLSLFFIFLTLGRLAGSVFNFKFHNIIILRISLALTFIALLLGIYVHPYFLPFSSLFMSIFYPTYMDYLAGTFNEGTEFMLSSVMTYIGVILAFFHWFFGYFSDSYGLESAILLCPFLAMISFYSTYLLPKKSVS